MNPRSTLQSRSATRADLDSLRHLVNSAIDELQKAYLDERQIAASHAIMGVDTQLIDDHTYFVIECEGTLAGCGGWSRRATLYGSDDSENRDATLLDPRAQPARVRAMYTHPAFVRRGVGSLILQLCEQAAAAEGFGRLELMATLSGRPLYEAAGFVPVEDVMASVNGVDIPLTRMAKHIRTAATSDRGATTTGARPVVQP